MRRILVCLAVGMLTVGLMRNGYRRRRSRLPCDGPGSGHEIASGAFWPQLTGPMFQYPWQKAVYEDAAKIPKVLYQLPCYCRCDRNMGHTSLHSCFEGLHGAECSTCAKEGYYAYQMSLKGKTVQEIRAGDHAQGVRKHRSELDWHVAAYNGKVSERGRHGFDGID